LPFYFLFLPYNEFVRRRKSTIFFLVLGICLIILAVALNVSWILLNLEKVVLLVLGIIFFAIIITGLVLNTTFLLREIKRNEQQDAFLNSVTHELKTPIASIRLYLETLKTRDVNEEKRQEFYNIMLKDSDRLLNTVEQVLHASRTRDEKKLTNAANINLTTLLQDSIEQIRSRYNFDENVITFTKADDFNIIGDANELQSVFANLLDNAVKYSDKNVHVSVEVKEFDEKTVEICIKDEGVGIAKNQLKRIFNRFYRIPSLSTQKAKGTGLGLFIVRFIVKKHGGKIFAESLGEGFGTTFRVQLPKK
jgi:two-component system, OmpR family, sensor histidine kinase SenX3